MWKIVFCTWYGYLKYQIIPFDLFNSSTSFQRYSYKILAEKLDVVIIVYWDDILIYTNKVDQVDAIY